jgi:hypothetical protein
MVSRGCLILGERVHCKYDIIYMYTIYYIYILYTITFTSRGYLLEKPHIYIYTYAIVQPIGILHVHLQMLELDMYIIIHILTYIYHLISIDI